jgi:preprotein translocase subunit Sec63
VKDTFEYYKALGLEPSASPQRIRKAYLELCHLYDPSLYVDDDPERVAEAEQKRKDIEEAYRGIRHFLPELKHPLNYYEATTGEHRDFNEMVITGGPKVPLRDLARMFLTIAVIGILWFGFYLYRKTQAFHTNPTTIEAEPVPSQGPSAP